MLTMLVCNGARWIDLSDPCIRDSLATIVPTAFVGATIVAAFPPVRAKLRDIGRPLLDFLSLPEAEALLARKAYDKPGHQHHIGSPTRVFLTAISLVEFLVWLGLGCYRFVMDFNNAYSGIRCAVLSSTWLYAVLRAIVWPTVTVTFDLFFLFTLHLSFALINGSGYLFNHYLYQTPFPPPLEIVLYVANLLAITVLLIVVFNMPLAIPNEPIRKEDTVRGSLLYNSSSVSVFVPL